MRYRHFLSLVLVLSVLAVQPAHAEGLFPSANKLFGELMPSMVFALGRSGDDNGGTVFSGVTQDEYNKLGKYLSGDGCALESTEVNDREAVFTVTKNGTAMTLKYNPGEGRLSVAYAEGSRVETTAAAASEKSLFPALKDLFAVKVPSMAALVTWAADRDTTASDGSRTLVYNSISETDYDAFGGLLGAAGFRQQAASVNGGSIETVAVNGYAALTVSYNPAAHSLTLVSNSYCVPAVLSAKGSNILPAVDSLMGVTLPSIAQAFDRAPDKEETLEDGSLRQSFTGFDDNAYVSFNTYIGNQGCVMAGYTVDGSVMNIQLSKDGIVFAFIYDRENRTAAMVYPAGYRAAEMKLVTPTPKPSPTPTPKPTKNNYSYSTPKPASGTMQTGQSLPKYISSYNGSGYVSNIRYYFSGSRLKVTGDFKCSSVDSKYMTIYAHVVGSNGYSYSDSTILQAAKGNTYSFTLTFDCSSSYSYTLYFD